MSAVRGAVRRVLTGHEPYPAVAVDRLWNLVDQNESVTLFTDGVSRGLLEPPTNALRLALHPEGMAPRITNLGEWRSHLLARLRRRVAQGADLDLARLYEELRAYPCEQPEPEVEPFGAGEVVVPLRIHREGRELAFLGIVATFGTPLDVTVSELAIESFSPRIPKRPPCSGRAS